MSVSKGRKKANSSAFDSKLWPVHAMTVSRSASHIASTLSPQQRINALAEALADVAKDFGDDAIDGFLVAMKGWFAQRDYGAAVELVGYFQEHGRLPEIAPPSQTARRGSRGSSKNVNTPSLRAA
ncbi:hypothetical protein ASG35_17695 [Burkholderia sp. Leaf177]|uniref:hypothetical protein n=1 Tax=Burkholderia sp. Leaf177 TaxID=1736287 RepID=UPI0006F272A7|nr:hypothetical protein [Burkholderia sp. Leaf177]KQR74584.1 hypothetical protein ASG35_17695 [Burkholderia sp. Leaf177]